MSFFKGVTSALARAVASCPQFNDFEFLKAHKVEEDSSEVMTKTFDQETSIRKVIQSFNKICECSSGDRWSVFDGRSRYDESSYKKIRSLPEKNISHISELSVKVRSFSIEWHNKPVEHVTQVVVSTKLIVDGDGGVDGFPKRRHHTYEAYVEDGCLKPVGLPILDDSMRDRD